LTSAGRVTSLGHLPGRGGSAAHGPRALAGPDDRHGPAGCLAPPQWRVLDLLLVAHAVLIIWGYAVTAHDGLVSETKTVVLTYPDMLAATVGLALLVVVGVLSAGR